jgi:hypothetical protein
MNARAGSDVAEVGNGVPTLPQMLKPLGASELGPPVTTPTFACINRPRRTAAVT